MKKFLLFVIVAAIATFIATPSMALHKNYDGRLACGGCHTMHNSQGGSGTTLGGNPSIVLLRAAVGSRAQIHALCLQCHASNGAQSAATFDGGTHTAPKVFIEDALGGDGCGADAGCELRNQVDLELVGAGGDFSATLTDAWALDTADALTALGYGHSLGLQGVVPPGGDDTVASFSCTSCHDPHGTQTSTATGINPYRNLLISPDAGDPLATLSANTRSYVGMGGGTSWVGEGASNAVHRWPVYGSGAVYGAAGTCTDGLPSLDKVNCYGVTEDTAVASTSGIGYWCATCHDNWHEDVAAGGNISGVIGSGGDWTRHPVDQPVWTGGASRVSGASIDLIRLANYGSSGFGGAYSLPVSKSSNAGNNLAYIVSTTTPAELNGSRVFCLSCHFAHGGPYYDNLRWNYLSAVEASSQAANSIMATVGCQQCHNR